MLPAFSLPVLSITVMFSTPSPISLSIDLMSLTVPLAKPRELILLKASSESAVLSKAVRTGVLLSMEVIGRSPCLGGYLYLMRVLLFLSALRTTFF